MVECKLCGKSFKRLDSSHLPKFHKISGQEYLKLFPNSKLMSEESRQNYSQATINFFNSLTKEEKTGRCYIRTPEHRKAAQIRLARGRLENHDRIYGKNSDRNLKISNKKTLWWGEISSIDRKLMIMKNFYKFKFASNFRSSYEEYMLNILNNHQIDFVEQYLLDGWLFDCYLPKYDLLIEFDGDYWHPLSLEDCDKEYKKRWYYRDRKKEQYAVENNYKFIRIRQSEKDKIHEILKNLNSI